MKMMGKIKELLGIGEPRELRETPVDEPPKHRAVSYGRFTEAYKEAYEGLMGPLGALHSHLYCWDRWKGADPEKIADDRRLERHYWTARKYCRVIEQLDDFLERNVDTDDPEEKKMLETVTELHSLLSKAKQLKKSEWLERMYSLVDKVKSDMERDMQRTIERKRKREESRLTALFQRELAPQIGESDLLDGVDIQF